MSILSCPSQESLCKERIFRKFQASHNILLFTSILNSIELLRREHISTIETFLLKGKAGVRVLDKSQSEELHEN